MPNPRQWEQVAHVIAKSKHPHETYEEWLMRRDIAVYMADLFDTLHMQHWNRLTFLRMCNVLDCMPDLPDLTRGR